MQVIKKIKHGYRFLCLFKSRNLFVKDIAKASIRYRCYERILIFIDKYIEEMDDINELLYQKLPNDNRNIFIRFILKRFCYVDTVLPDEEEKICRAFDEAKKIYTLSKEDYLLIPFGEKTLKYPKREMRNVHNTDKENDLMNYYDVVHSFFLKEYQMDGFDPEDGQVIFDCGAATGDTLLLFKGLYPHSYVYSFECMEENIQIIKNVIRENNIKDVEIINGYLYCDSKKHYMIDSSSQIIDEKNDLEECHEINTLSIDEYVENNNIENIGLLKFDIEGGEQQALLASVRTIKKFKPLLYIPVYHLESDIYKIPQFLHSLNLPMKFKIKWTEKRVWGMDCVLFVRFL